MIPPDDQISDMKLEGRRSTSWKLIAFTVLCGIALGAVVFALIHPYEGGFRSSLPADGTIVDRMPLDTLLEGVLSPFAAGFGALIALASIALLKMRQVEFVRRALTAVVVFGAMSITQSSLQMRYDYQQTFGDSSGWSAGAARGAR